ncbi:uncharacterized protein BX664DRAFT_388650 [Halteromyces radiatus]|uniref:uncharacterized protein n=1 Tax=Halteromyces radiatus TaxID=101107 RepID=UPI00221F9C93|nr:uncharacterized protein BX664DRAFT_388650 [Halteromyces radiatus]KAI8081705.1 hypothetical protein BX664DRAFT_388650 [Halteromyces radiatus]
MIRSSIITVLLLSTCFHSFSSIVSGFEAEDITAGETAFTNAISANGGVLSSTGTEELVSGLVPDAQKLVDQLSRRDDIEETATEGTGVATYSDEPSGNGGALSTVTGITNAVLRKRLLGGLGLDGSQGSQEQGTGTSLTSGSGGSTESGGEETAKGLLSEVGLRRRGGLTGGLTGGLLGGGNKATTSDVSSEEQGGSQVSLIDLGRRDGSKFGAGITRGSLLALRRRLLEESNANTANQDDGGIVDNIVKTVGLGTSPGGVLRRDVNTDGDQNHKSDKKGNEKRSKYSLNDSIDNQDGDDRKARVERRSMNSIPLASGADRIARARQGVVVDPEQDKLAKQKRGSLLRRSGHYARDYADDKRQAMEDRRQAMEDYRKDQMEERKKLEELRQDQLEEQRKLDEERAEAGLLGNTDMQENTGLQGNTGSQGNAGLQGNVGSQGNAGLQGNTGSQGSNGSTRVSLISLRRRLLNGVVEKVTGAVGLDDNVKQSQTVGVAP